MTLVRVVGAIVLIGCAAAPPRAAFGDGKQAHAHTCTSADDCSVVPVSCCGRCGVASSGDARAALTETSHRPSRCRGLECPRCHRDPDPALVAYCASGTCRALDLHTSALTRCTEDSDCIVRPQGCCECGASAWVAVSASQSEAYTRRVCSPTVRCPACVGDPPPVGAVCRDAHCELGAARAGAPPTLEEQLGLE